VPVFVDTNVLVYAKDVSQPEKQATAAAWIEHLWTSAGGLTMQVLQEYGVTRQDRVEGSGVELAIRRPSDGSEELPLRSFPRT